MIIDAGYFDGEKYVEDLIYFSFDNLTEQEKQKILDEQNEKEYQEYLEYERNYYEYDSVA